MKIKMMMSVAAITAGLAACAQTNHKVVNPELTSTQLGDYEWKLVKAVDRQGARLTDFGNPASMTLHFNSQQMMVSGGCNDINAAYSLSKRRLDIKSPVSTRQSCEPAQMAKDAAFMNFIKNPGIKAKWVGSAQTEAQSEQPRLILKNPQGERLFWQGTPTLEHLYGQPTQLFWQVAAGNKLCLTTSGNVPCVRVREVYYNDQGIKTGNGPWQRFSGQIQGWTPEPLNEQVLRLKRYTRQEATATTSADYLYVLDMVVEQKQVLKMAHPDK